MAAPKDLFGGIPDQTGKVVIVTGGNAGIGKVTCRELLAKGATVYMGARNQQKAEQAIAELKEKTGKDNIHWLPMDLADLSSVRNAADQFTKNEKQLHVLVNNAGIMATEYRETKDGYEEQWGTNVVGHFALTTLLLPALLQTATDTPPGTVRVINISSTANNLAPKGGINFADLKLKDYAVGEWRRYGQSKLANLLFSKELARRYADKGLISVSLHPGVILTQLHHNTKSNWLLRNIISLIRPKDITEDEGAYTQLFAATDIKVVSQNLNGMYLEPYGKIGTPNKEATPLLAEMLWNHLENDLKIKLT